MKIRWESAGRLLAAAAAAVAIAGVAPSLLRPSDPEPLPGDVGLIAEPLPAPEPPSAPLSKARPKRSKVEAAKRRAARRLLAARRKRRERILAKERRGGKPKAKRERPPQGHEDAPAPVYAPPPPAPAYAPAAPPPPPAYTPAPAPPPSALDEFSFER